MRLYQPELEISQSVSRRLQLVLVLFFCFPNVTYAQSLAFSRNARTFEPQQASLVTKGLAFACLGLEVVPDSLPCQPAWTPLRKDPHLGVELMLSNGYGAVDNTRKLLSGEVSQDFINSLFGENRVLQIEGSGEIAFASKFLNSKYVPKNLKYFSVVRNQTNPDVELYAVEEDAYVFQSGIKVLPGLYTGVQVRSLNRKFIRKKFKLLTIATEAGKDALKPKTHSAIYIEPGFGYQLPWYWKPRISVLVANLGFISEKQPEWVEPTELQVGLGVTPNLLYGKLDLLLDYKGLNFEEDPQDRVHFGALYHFGAMYLMSGIDGNGTSGGIFYRLESINAGIMYSTTQFPRGNGDYFTQTIYVQIGWQI